MSGMRIGPRKGWDVRGAGSGSEPLGPGALPARAFHHRPPAQQLPPARHPQADESLQFRLLEFDRRLVQKAAEGGGSQLEFTASAGHESKTRDTVEQQRSQLSSTFWNGTTSTKWSGQPGAPPARVHLGYTLRDLNNNLQDQAQMPHVGRRMGKSLLWAHPHAASARRTPVSPPIWP